MECYWIVIIYKFCHPKQSSLRSSTILIRNTDFSSNVNIHINLGLSCFLMILNDYCHSLLYYPVSKYVCATCTRKTYCVVITYITMSYINIRFDAHIKSAWIGRYFHAFYRKRVYLCPPGNRYDWNTDYYLFLYWYNE